MRIAVAGSHGLIGSALTDSLAASGHQVTRLVRGTESGSGQIRWDPEAEPLAPEVLDGVDAVVGLGGVGIGDARWSGAVKQRLRDSRITPTEVLAEAVRDAGIPVFVNASATGYYGDTGRDAVTEASPAGTGFLAGLTADWEAATAAASESSRVVLLRTAPVLSRSGGLLARLRRIYRLGLGGPIGSGRQFFSWITLPDAIGAITHALTDEDIAGPVNLSAPQQVRYREFSDLLAARLHRPAFVHVPGAVARAAGGEMAQELLLASSRVEPAVLTGTGYVFEQPTLAEALEYTDA
ncbi:MAG: TIGR01777 family oxidoreductase [Gordonia sp. (in: high G+C Gram-positive bacteria)]|uniref:TIGR01777 family oxidoreductase n=1 Tax=Gordonia sp. (in: high G+C Gram-positive bacteria) TaxID=84139 RepID=UPI0039E2BE0D